MDSIFARYPFSTGIALGVFALVPHFFLSPEMSLAFAAVLLEIVAGVYFGFAVMKGSNFQQQDRPHRHLALERGAFNL